MEYNTNEMALLDTGCWANVVEGVKFTFKEWVREVVEEVITDKMCNANLEDKRLTADELCERWNISKNTLHNWENRGVIQPLPLDGKKKVYSMADIHSAEINGYIRSAC